jgi:hypothetical protein
MQIDEDTWTVPAGWWAKAVPARGLTPPRKITPSPKAVARRAEYVARNTGTVRDILARTAAAGYAELAEAGTVALQSPTKATHDTVMTNH